MHTRQPCRTMSWMACARAPLAACAAGHYQDTEGMASCKPWTVCVTPTIYSDLGSRSRDRVCGETCGPGTEPNENQSRCIDINEYAARGAGRAARGAPGCGAVDMRAAAARRGAWDL